MRTFHFLISAIWVAASIHANDLERIAEQNQHSSLRIFVREHLLHNGAVVESVHYDKSGASSTLWDLTDVGNCIEVWRYERGMDMPALGNASTIKVDSQTVARVAIEPAVSGLNESVQSGDLLRVGLLLDEGPHTWILSSWGEDDFGGFIEHYGAWEFSGGSRVLELPAENLSGRDVFAIYRVIKGGEPILVAQRSIKVAPRPTVHFNFPNGSKLDTEDQIIISGQGFRETDLVKVILKDSVLGAEQLIAVSKEDDEFEIWKDVFMLPAQSGKNGSFEISIIRDYMGASGRMTSELIGSCQFKLNMHN